MFDWCGGWWIVGIDMPKRFGAWIVPIVNLKSDTAITVEETSILSTMIKRKLLIVLQVRRKSFFNAQVYKIERRINVLECHRIVDSSHCPICGHRYHDNKVNVQLDSNEGDVYSMENPTSSSSCNLQLKVDISTRYPLLTRSTSTSLSSTIVSCITMKESPAIILQIQFILYWIVTWKCTCFDSISILF